MSENERNPAGGQFAGGLVPTSSAPSQEVVVAERSQGQPLLQQTLAEPGEVPSSGTQKFLVIMVRSGVAPKKYYVPPGTTIQDLANDIKANIQNHDLRINEDLVQSSHVLQPNTVLFAIPRPKNAS